MPVSTAASGARWIRLCLAPLLMWLAFMSTAGAAVVTPSVILVEVGTHKLVRQTDAIKRIAVGDPAIADVNVINGREVLITGKTLAHVGARFHVTPLGERLFPAQKAKTAVFEVLDEDSDSGTLSGIR